MILSVFQHYVGQKSSVRCVATRQCTIYVICLISPSLQKCPNVKTLMWDYKVRVALDSEFVHVTLYIRVFDKLVQSVRKQAKEI